LLSGAWLKAQKDNEAATVALAKPCSSSVHLANSRLSQAHILARHSALVDAGCADVTDSTAPQSWFAVFTRSHHEKKVWEYFRQQQIDSFLPLYSQIRHWTNRRRVRLQLPLFPNYLFVRIERRHRGRVLGVQGVLSIVGRGCEPTALSDFEIESLRSGLHLREFEPHPFLVVGTRVRIKVGPLEGMEGVLLRTKNSLRVVLTVALINQSLSVEVDAEDVEPVHWHPAPPSLFVASCVS
jgi:transcription antitermination factor NusG